MISQESAHDYRIVAVFMVLWIMIILFGVVAVFMRMVG
jgi:hypothetical protein